MTAGVRLLLAAGVLAGTAGCGERAASARRAAPPSAALRFVDAAGAAGIRFLHTDGGSGRHYFNEQIGSGCAFLDYDNDGRVDLYAVSGAPLPGFHKAGRFRHELFRNEGGGRFRQATDEAGLGSTRYGHGVCAGDFDNDGWTDLFVASYGRCHLYRNDRGRFRDVADRAGVAGDGGLHTSAAFLDYDNDGDLDLYVCRYVQWRLEEDRWCGKSRLKKSYCGPEVYPARRDSLFRNNGDGTFTDVAATAGIAQRRSKSLGVVPADVNDDGWPDLYVACDLEPNLLFINQGNGTFREEGVVQGVAFGQDGAAEAGMGVASGDYDRDGRLDLFVTNYSYEMYGLYRNAGGGLFTYESVRTGIGPPTLLPLGFGTRFGDFDNDGWPDLIVANGHVLDDVKEGNEALEYAQPLMLLMNAQGRRFRDMSAAAGPAFAAKHVGRGLAIADYDEDGRLDCAVNNVNGPLRLVRNESTVRGGWLALRLEGTRSNRDAIGARVRVRTGTSWQTAEVVSGGSYLSQSDLRLHFGLGETGQADEVRVRWPGARGRPGREEVWTGLSGGRLHTLREGEAPRGGDAS